MKIVDHKINSGKGRIKYIKEGISEVSKVGTNGGASGKKMVLNKEMAAREGKNMVSDTTCEAA